MQSWKVKSHLALGLLQISYELKRHVLMPLKCLVTMKNWWVVEDLSME